MLDAIKKHGAKVVSAVVALAVIIGGFMYMKKEDERKAEAEKVEAEKSEQQEVAVESEVVEAESNEKVEETVVETEEAAYDKETKTS